MAAKKKTYYKLLNTDGTPSNGGKGFVYSLPVDGKPGEWSPTIDNVEACSRGYHVVEFEYILDWRGPLLCVADVRGAIDGGNKYVAKQIRLMSIVEGWNAKNLRLFAADCAKRVLPIFEKKHPGDTRPRDAITAARAFAHGKISLDAMMKARNAADAADADAAVDAAADADAADAAYAAAYAAADAYADAYAAAAYAAYADAYAAADARTKERAWQIQRLKHYLGVK